ncbi:MAG: AAA family ATPase [Planctomycetaceae bacterium]|nr:AAA family ATPase [Planctomycetaceae bacterium]
MSETSFSLLRPEEIKPVAERFELLLAELDRILLGRPELHRMVVTGILSRGHILLEGVPGVGKTALIKALGDLMHLKFSRVQFTPDLMPGDILGTNILQETSAGHREMVFQPGPVFANILLADEINRASPKTQSALLEAMQERCVTLLGQTRPLPKPFFVLASQNPIELEGTYPLPEAQLDRFLFKLFVDPPKAGVLEKIITTRRHGTPPESGFRISPEMLDETFAVLDRVYLPQAVAAYIGRLVAATHPGSEEAIGEINEYVTFGASPRAAIAIAEAAKTSALLNGRPSAGFEDVRTVAPAVLNHRILLGYRARMDKVDSRQIVAAMLAKLDEVSMGLPKSVSVG